MRIIHKMNLDFSTQNNTQRFSLNLNYQILNENKFLELTTIIYGFLKDLDLKISLELVVVGDLVITLNYKTQQRGWIEFYSLKDKNF